MSGPSGIIIGKQREIATCDIILSLRSRYSWIRDARLATQDEDGRGIDIVITTHSGKLFVQVKSDQRSMRRWWAKYGAVIGHMTMQVVWKGEQIATPENFATELHNHYVRLTNRVNRCKAKRKRIEDRREAFVLTGDL